MKFYSSQSGWEMRSFAFLKGVEWGEKTFTPNFV